MNIDDIREAVRQRGLAASRRQFSRGYLGRGANYLADRKGECSAGAVLNLCRSLGETGQHDLQALALKRLLGAGARP